MRERFVISVLLLVLLYSNCVKSFNFETRLPIIKYGEKGEYFGYSVSEHQVLETNSRQVIQPILLVGAPKASTGQPGTNHSGAVYKCYINTYKRDCEQINIEYDTKPPEEHILKNDQWLGVTVKSQGPGGYVLACAHRYILKGPDYQWGQGICYSLTQFLDFHRAWEPCLNRPVAKAHEQFGYCQAGTSGDITEDHSLVIGSPGPYTWKGTVFTNNVRFSIRDDKTWYMGPLLDENAPVDKYSYLGVSVTSGKFFGDATSYVGGAPRGNGTGQVVFFTKQKADSTFAVQLVLNGEQFASSFGYSLTSVDLNSDGYPDLIVGAPFYYEKSNGGAVYIYLNSEEGFNETTKPIKLTGKYESQFGLSVAGIGDINKDGFSDFAIGAPYEGTGAVYIYLGSSEGFIIDPVQVVRVKDLAKEAQGGLRSFGYSLSGGMDLDNNTYPDLLIGAYESDAVITLRTRPIIDIVTSVEGNLVNIDPSSHGCEEDVNSSLLCFSFKACFHFNSSVLQHGSALDMAYRIEAETFTGKKYYRVKFRSSLDSETPNIVEKEIPVRGASLYRQFCYKEVVYLKEKIDIQTPIKFKLTYTLIQKEPKMPKQGRDLPNINLYPILNKRESSRVFEAKFLKDCGSDDICESDLHLKAEFNLPREENGSPILFLGEQQVSLTITVYNYQEPAYDTSLYIYHQKALSYVGRKVLRGDQAECSPFNATTLKCELGNPMTMGEIEFQVRFNTRNIPDDERLLQFELKVNTSSIEITPEDNLILQAEIVRMAELELRGVSLPEQVFYGGEKDDEMPKSDEMEYFEDIGNSLEHVYEVINYGPYKANEVEVLISWPYQMLDFRGNKKWLLYVTETPKVQGNGFCLPEADMINPLKLKSKKQDDDDAHSGAITARERTKRSVAPEEIRMDGKTVNVVVLDCEKGSAKCHYFSCILRDLQADQTALIKIKARLWNSTFVEDFPKVDWVSVMSQAHVQMHTSLDIRQKVENDYAYAETKAYPDLPLYQKPEEVPLWIIILAICGGLILLIILILCLWKIGFFKRKKPGYMVAATSDKEKEANNL